VASNNQLRAGTGIRQIALPGGPSSSARQNDWLTGRAGGPTPLMRKGLPFSGACQDARSSANDHRDLGSKSGHQPRTKVIRRR